MKRVRWYKKLYMGEMARKQRYKIDWKVKHKAGLLNTYLITVPLTGNNQLEIIDSSQLLQKHYNYTTVCIAGIAIGYEAALELVETITIDVLNTTNTVDIRKFFKKAFQEIQ